MIWDTSTWSRKPCNPSTTRLARGCHPCLRYDLLPMCSGLDNLKDGGAGGIRTLDRALQPYNGLANRRLQPLGHSSIRADMPDARASRKRQIQITPKPFRGSGFKGAGASRRRTRCQTRHWRGVFAVRLPRAGSKSRENDLTPPAGDSIPAGSRFQTARRAGSWYGGTLWTLPIPEMSGFHHLSPVFALVGHSPGARRAPPGLHPHAWGPLLTL